VLLPNKDEEVEVEVMVVISPNVPKILFLDETYINRILMNLLSNSLKFTRSGYVMLSLEMDGTDLEIKVKDTGIGIPPSFLKHLFEPFSQAQTRGSQRGTGLGLSIVKKLVNKMEGTIDVESKHAEQGYEPDETGTTSIVTIPALASPLSSSPKSDTQHTKSTIAILRPTNARILEGLEIAWELFGYDPVVVEDIEDVKYVWADFRFLQQSPDGLRRLMNQEKWTALIPFDNQETLQRLPGLLSTPHFVPLQKPLTWHTFDSRIALASHSTPNHSFSRSVRFATESVTADESTPPSPDGMTSKNVHILLVEDNPVSPTLSLIHSFTNTFKINQKLGNKMLTSLGYSVLLASDGDEAISQVLLHDTTIEMILMDQCMPIKDGVTATREIRELEEQGKMKRRHRIIALTAVVGTESRAQFREAGADEFLAKPLSMGKLEQTLATFLRVE
jgi:CheY-like chemotaxis protein/anti-sigma regulatory factor (Ser/Thr protein kinase)